MCEVIAKTSSIDSWAHITSSLYQDIERIALPMDVKDNFLKLQFRNEDTTYIYSLYKYLE
ncbi:hypothetical protein [Teredinibacter haidensis]|uniref:hypothetical protein n=1 Tax=Teredinibacter haidensis TaxID=2731755 RepID=UPI000948E57D|nr:hypothetical protein [Teredinibacter haidensis]